MEEVGFWVKGECMTEKKIDESDEDESIAQSTWGPEENKAQVLVKSCIFYNFFD